MTADLDALVAEWHDAPPGSPAASMKLHEWLGMTWEQYAEWVADPDALPPELPGKS